MNWVDNVNWPPLRVSKQTFGALSLCLSKWHEWHEDYLTCFSNSLTASSGLVYPLVLVEDSVEVNTQLSGNASASTAASDRYE